MDDLIEYHYIHGGTHLFLDEVHKYRDWQWGINMEGFNDRLAEVCRQVIEQDIPAERYPCRRKVSV